MGLAHAFAALVLCVIFSGGLYLLKRPASDASDRIVGAVAVLLSVGGMLVVGGAAALAADPASAATPPPWSPSPWSDVAGTAIAGAASVASAVIVALFELFRRQLKARLGVELNDQARAYVQDAADRFAGFAAARLSAMALGSAPPPTAATLMMVPRPAPVPAYDAVLDEMVDAMVEQVPDGLSRLGVDAAGVRRMLAVRLAASGILPPQAG